MTAVAYRPRHSYGRPGAVTLAQLGITVAGRKRPVLATWHRWYTQRFATQVNGVVALLVMSLATVTVSVLVAMIANRGT